MRKLREGHGLEHMLIGFLILLLFITIASMLFFHSLMLDTNNTGDITQLKEKKHYVFISGEYSNPTIDDLYDSIKENVEKNGALIEYFGKKLAVEYSVSELIELATHAKVDGMFIVGEDNSKVASAINQALAEHIPVITVYKDCSISKRSCFVGINGYALGESFARKLESYHGDKEKNVYIIMNSVQDKAVMKGIRVYLNQKKEQEKFHLKEIQIESQEKFTSEEMIRELVLSKEEKADVLLCLTSVDTSSAYQILVDYNKVGKINVLGYGTSEPILEGIQKGIITATVAIDIKEMGALSVKAMLEHEQNSNARTTISLPVEFIDQGMLSEYRKRKGGLK